MRPIVIVEEDDFRQFNRNDWSIWAGAADWDDKHPPMICETKQFTVICDLNGIEIYLALPEKPDDGDAHKKFNLRMGTNGWRYKDWIEYVNRPGIPMDAAMLWTIGFSLTDEHS